MIYNSIKAYYDFSTKNESFIKVHKALESKGIKNNKFMLTIFNSDLIGIDPHDPNLDIFMKKQIVEECMKNYWYYIREVVRLPIQGGDTMIYDADCSNIAQSWCTLLNIDTWTIKPRQTKLTMFSLVLLSWILLFSSKGTDININSRIIRDAIFKNMRLKMIIQNLPDYIQIIKIANDSPKEIINTAAANIIRAKSLYKYDDSVFDTNYSYVDDAAFIKKIGMIVDESRKYSDENHIRIFTSVRNGYGRAIEEPIVLSSKRWYEDLYDFDLKYLKEEVNKTKTGLMYIEYNFKDLWKTDDWVEEQKLSLRDEEIIFNAEVLLQWKE